AGAFRALGEAPPEELEQPVSESGAPAIAEPPTALIRPRIGVPGRATGFYEWYGAGRYPVPRGAAMAEAPLIDVIRYGFDRGHLSRRLEPAPGRAGELAELTLHVDLRVGERHVGLQASKAGWRIAELGSYEAPVAFGRTIEIGVPFERLGLKPGDEVQMS